VVVSVPNRLSNARLATNIHTKDSSPTAHGHTFTHHSAENIITGPIGTHKEAGSQLIGGAGVQ
jgi:hypothetical protein